MNCFQFQHQLNRQPAQLGEKARQHAETCPGCRQRLASVQTLDDDLHALLAVAPPQGLEQRVLLQHRLQRPRQLWRTPAAIAAATATLLVASWLLVAPSTPPLAETMAQHVAQEAKLFQQTSERIDESLANTSIASIGGKLIGSLPLILVEPCDVPGGKGAHLVFDTSAGRTIMTTMPNHDAADSVRKAAAMISVVHRAPHGIYSLVARNHAAIDLTRELLNSQIDWQI